MVGYAYASDYTCGNILLNFDPKDTVMGVARAALSVSLLCTYPLIVLPCRGAVSKLVALCQASSDAQGLGGLVQQQGGGAGENLRDPRLADVDDDMLSVTQRIAQEASSLEQGLLSGIHGDGLDEGKGEEKGEGSGGSDSSEEDPNLVYVYANREGSTGGLVMVDTYIPKDTAAEDTVETGPVTHALYTVGLIGSSLLVAVFLNAVMVIWTIMGATVCFMIAFVLPTLYFLQLAPVRTNPWSRARRAVAKFLLAFSAVSCIGCTTVTIAKVVAGTHSCPKW